MSIFFPASLRHSLPFVEITILHADVADTFKIIIPLYRGNFVLFAASIYELIVVNYFIL